MFKVQYKNHINHLLLEFDDHNLKAKVTRIVFRKLIRDQLPEEALRGMSMHKEYFDDRVWLETLLI